MTGKSHSKGSGAPPAAPQGKTPAEQEAIIKRYREQAALVKDVCVDVATGQVFVAGRHNLEISDRILAIPISSLLTMAAAAVGGVYQLAGQLGMPMAGKDS